ncbi:MAG: sulfatase, partial [Chthoniobacteraceae bacterium]
MNFDPLSHELALHHTRRQFFGRTAQGIGLAALGSLLNRELFAAPGPATRGALPALHFAPKAKHVIYLHQSGAP